MRLELNVSTLEAMESLAKIIGTQVKPGFVIGLKGDLGSGKTTFTKFLAKAMGIADNVNSPTFTILKIYPGNIPLYHMDVYRLEDIGYDFELEEYIYNEGVAVIEWYPYIQTMLPPEMLSIEILILDQDTRKVQIEGSGKYAEIVETIGNRYGD